MLITGCSTGIGRATAELLAREGHTVYATARRLESIEDLRESGCRTLALDVTDEASMSAAVGAVEEAEGAVGALVNNAGYSQSGAVESVPHGRACAPSSRPTCSAWCGCASSCCPGMRRAGRGRIVNVSSMGGKLVFPGGGIYHATKYAVEAISDAHALRGQGLRHPGRGDRARADQDELRGDGGGVDGATASEEGPYAGFNQAVAAATAGAYDGPMGRLGAGPEAVAKAIRKAR